MADRSGMSVRKCILVPRLLSVGGQCHLAKDTPNFCSEWGFNDGFLYDFPSESTHSLNLGEDFCQLKNSMSNLRGDTTAFQIN